MKIIDKPYFECEFCGKKQFRKCDMAKHEKWCKKNPVNDHLCFHYCIHLIKDREDVEGTGDYDTPPVSRCTFQCAITKQFMYSFKAERRKIVDRLPKEVIRMPLITECPHYKDNMDAYFGDYTNDTDADTLYSTKD